MRTSSMGLLAVLLWAAAPGAQAKIVCWNDDKGQRMCGDRVPPEYADTKREVFNDRGMVVETLRGAKTPEEIAEEERKAREAEERKKREDYDRSLLSVYRSAKDIENMRDERLILIDGRITAAQKALADNENSLKGLQERADALTRENKPVDEKLARQIKQFTKSLAENQRAIERYRQEREEVKTKFNADLARFNELRPPVPAPEAKKAGS